MSRRALTLGCAVCIGCGGDGVDATLADLQNPGLEVFIESIAVGNSIASIRFDGVDSRFPDECPILGDDLEGRFRGRVMTVRERGGRGESTCELPALEIAADAIASNNVVEVKDGSLTITATFIASALEPRIATHESWTFPRNTAASVDWSHPDDLVGAMPAVTVGGREIAGASNGSQIGFTIPADAPTGMVELIVKSNDAMADVANRCDGATSCRAMQAGYYHHAATIQ